MRLRIVAGRAACTLACQAVACRAFLAPAGSLASTPAALAAAHRPLSHPRHVTHALASSRPHGIGRCHIAERCYAAVGGARSRRARALRMVNGGWQPGGGGSTSLSPGARAAFTALSVIGALWVGKVVSQSIGSAIGSASATGTGASASAALFLLLPLFAAASLLIFTVAAQAAMLVFFVPVVATLALAPLLMVLPTGGLLLSLPTIMWLAYR
ncbi:hypothetical protein JKP88DRAFT_321659 [Tribonema minus]|uniref:Uncharacterized protein n=1 Tax=Tribonema minus TaxID=303371 RepID=A0A835YTT4_9STRA|nr:hypothetical protein JKP88DRAFT_321659 [Tribonema minus]